MGRKLVRVLRILGPGLAAGSAVDDPSGIGTYAIAGALLGYTTLWTAVFTIPMMIAVQFICAKLSLVGLAGAGLLAVPVLTGWAAYAIAGARHWAADWIARSPVLLLANRRSIVKEHRNGLLLNVVGWTTAIVMSVAAPGALLTGALGS